MSTVTQGERGRTGRGQLGRTAGSPTGPGARLGQGTINTIPPEIIPAPGSAGSEIQLSTNFVEWRAQQPEAQTYHVVFKEPAVEQISLRRKLVLHLRTMEDPVILGAYIYDGDANLKTIAPIGHLNEEAEVSVNLNDTNYLIKIISTGTISMGSPEMLRLYNTQSRANLRRLGFVQIGRDFYDPTTARELKIKDVCLWFGIDATVSSFQDSRQLMVINSISKVVRRETAFDLMKNVRARNPNNFIPAVRSALVGRTVLTRYNNKHYRVADVDFDSNPESTFSYTNKNTKQTSQTSFSQYVSQQYGCEVASKTQPLLVATLSARDRRAGKTEAPKLIPELCILTGIADLIGDTQLRREMISATKKNPTERVRDIHAFMQKCASNAEIKQEMSSWGLEFSNSLVTLTGRVLPPEKITLHGGNSFNFDGPNEIDRNLARNRMKEVVDINNWFVIHTPRDIEILRNFLTILRDQCTKLGLHLAKPNMMPLNDDRIHSYMAAINQVDSGAQFVMAMIGRDTETDKYAAIKKKLCIEKPIPSQVIVARKVSGEARKVASIATKVAIQINCKLGGIPWELDMPPVKLMVCGYDAHHDTTLRKSVGGFVSSLNASMTRWFSRVRYHDRLEELSTHFKANMTEALEAYKKVNGSFPSKIVLYRDGVSEGQLRHVHEIEKMQIREAIDEISPQINIQLSIVVVTKRVAARFFVKKGSNEYANPGPGTIADTVVRRALSYDFFLISQHVHEGTISPVNYNIIEDKTGWTMTHHQRLAYKLCHLYFNWTGTVKVPCPCQYAHKLSFLVGTHLHAEPHRSLSDKLFFL